MVFEEIIGSVDSIYLVGILVAFVVFLYLMQKVVKTLINIVLVAVLSAVFPFVANTVGISVPTDIAAILFFVVAGIGLYLIYTIIKIILAPFGVIGKILGMLFPSKKK